MEKVACHGPRIMLRAEAVQNVALALHELATNAAKYGALSRPEGRIVVRWAAHKGQLALTWRETGGPQVVAPSRRGFGSTLLEQAVIGGSARLDFAADGVRYSLTVPLENP